MINNGPHRALVTALTLLLALALTGANPSPTSAAGSTGRLRVATYNIHAGIGSDGVFDLGRTATALRSLRADVIGLQEVDRHWDARSEWRDTIGELAEELDMQARFAPIYSFDPPAPGEPRREYGLAILSRYPITGFTDHEITRLSSQNPEQGPILMPGFPEIEISVRGTDVHIYNTHLDYRPEPALREVEVAETLEIMAEDDPGAVQFLVGDFNAEPGDAELAPLWQQLTDGYAAAGTGSGLSYPGDVPEKRIDFVTASPGVSFRSATVPGSVLAAEASDHRPVVTDVVFPRG